MRPSPGPPPPRTGATYPAHALRGAPLATAASLAVPRRHARHARPDRHPPLPPFQARLAYIAAEARVAVASGAAALPAALDAVPRRVTSTLFLAGAAMAPALNRGALSDRSSIEGLLLWRAPGGCAARVGDVVAFLAPADPPLAPGAALEATGAVLVRRVAAIAGDVLTADADEGGGGEAEETSVPPGHVWVLADNEALPPPAARDSRTLGFIPTSSILGRVIYAAASAGDHAPVDGLPRATAAGAAGVLAAELDVGALLAPAMAAGAGAASPGRGGGEPAA